MSVDELRFQFLQSAPYSERLAKDVDTVAILFDHLLNTRQMALDIAEALYGVVSGLDLCFFVTLVTVVLMNHDVLAMWRVFFT
jgi:hypothetical protein